MAVRFYFALAAAMAVFWAPAGAQDPAPASLRADPFSALVGKRKPASERSEATGAVERYEVAADDRVFLFQSAARAGRLKFLCGDGDDRIDCLIDPENPAEEIHLLTASRVSRGDVAWRDSEGGTLMRVAAYGGVTVYWPGEARGHAASKTFGDDPPLILAFAPLDTARRRAQRATALISAKLGAPIVFEIGAPDPDRDGGARVLADAVVRAADGVATVADDPTGARVIASRLRQVVFRPAAGPALGVDNDSLIVGYNSEGGVAGRPSSARIARFLEESL